MVFAASNAASTVVVALILALAGLAGWRWYRKGEPCGCNCGHCGGKGKSAPSSGASCCSSGGKSCCCS